MLRWGFVSVPRYPIVAAVRVQRRLFTAEEFARMDEAGILAGGDPVEPIDGEIREMAPMGPLHAGIVDRLAELLITRLAGRATVRIRNPIRLERRTKPQPDPAIARRRTDYYSSRHPEAGDLLLVIEVADSSVLYDRVEKMPRYAAAGIPEAWLVDAAAGAVTAYTGPGPAGYTEDRTLRRGEVIVSASLAGLRLLVGEILG